MKSRRLLAILASVVFLNSCGTVPITGRKRLSLVGEGQLLSLSRSQYQGFVHQARGKGILRQDARVHNICYRLIRAADSYLRAHGQADLLKHMSWEVNVIESDQINAFCMPGGKIAVYTGLIKMLGSGDRADAELAAVLGHEISHALAKHSHERMSNSIASGTLGSIVGAFIGAKSPVLADMFSLAYGLGEQGFVALPFARKQEYEADRMGLTLMSLAGYDPRTAVTLWEKMERNTSGGRSSEFFSTHPLESNRIRAIQDLLPEVMPLYEKALKGQNTSRHSLSTDDTHPFRYEGVSSRSKHK